MAVFLVSFVTVLFFPLLYANSPSINDVLFNGDYFYTDLTHPYDNYTVHWPDARRFEFTKKIETLSSDGSWYASNDFAVGEHCGTHIDAPYHFNINGKHVGELPVGKLIVPLIIVDISSRVDDPDFVLYKHHVDFMLHDNFGKPCVVIFKFGWSRFINNKQKYFGYDKNNTMHFPGLSAEIAEWITSSYKNVVGVGVDTASVDPGSSTEYLAHKILASAGLYNIENVKLDSHVPEYGCTALVMPMKIAVGSGAPLRLVALCPKNKSFIHSYFHLHP